jgi:hypothetical protein
MAMTYSEQLKHPRWQRRRLEVLSANGFQCSSCSTEDVTLHVHHKRYVKGRQVWEYPDAELAVLCENCHEQFHEWKAMLDELLTMVPTSDIGAATAMFAGILEAVWFAGPLIERVGTASSLHYHSGVAAGLARRVYMQACRQARGDEFWTDFGLLVDKYMTEEGAEPA